jgi:hypothetical protein
MDSRTSKSPIPRPAAPLGAAAFSGRISSPADLTAVLCSQPTKVGQSGNRTGSNQPREHREFSPATSRIRSSTLSTESPLVPSPSVSALRVPRSEFLGKHRQKRKPKSLHRSSFQPIPAYSPGVYTATLRLFSVRLSFLCMLLLNGSQSVFIRGNPWSKLRKKQKLPNEPILVMKTSGAQSSGRNRIRCSVLEVRCPMLLNRDSRYFPWFALSNRPEYRIGIPRRCIRNAGASIVIEQSSRELRKKQFDRIGNRMDHLMIVMAAGKTLIVSSDGRGTEVVGCKKLVTRTGVQQPATKPKRQQLYFTHATPLEK